MEEYVTLGVPESPVYLPAEEGVTKIGGIPHWLCPPPEKIDEIRCRCCGTKIEHILSCDCPLQDEYDRILYLYICPKCGQDARAWRQKRPVGSADQPIFSVNTPADQVAPEVPVQPEENVPQTEPEEPKKTDMMAALAAFNAAEPAKKGKKKAKKALPPIETGRWPGMYIETFEEPEAQIDESVQYMMSSSIESNTSISSTTLNEEEDTTKISQELIEFNERLSRCPEQVIRYSKGGKPLVDRKFNPKIPDCPICHGKRDFEVELLPTIIFTLDPESDMDFGAILVYTCANDCDCKCTEEHCVIIQP